MECVEYPNPIGDGNQKGTEAGRSMCSSFWDRILLEPRAERETPTPLLPGIDAVHKHILVQHAVFSSPKKLNYKMLLYTPLSLSSHSDSGYGQRPSVSCRQYKNLLIAGKLSRYS